MDQSQPQVAPQRPAVPASAPQSQPSAGSQQVHVQPVHAGVGAGLSSWGQQSPAAVPADSGFDVDLASVVVPDLTGSRSDDMDVPDFLK
jgi:cell division protein FtsZ